MSQRPNGRNRTRDACGANPAAADAAARSLTPEEVARAERHAIISRLNPDGLTGDAREINRQKLAFEGQ